MPILSPFLVCFGTISLFALSLSRARGEEYEHPQETPILRENVVGVAGFDQLEVLADGTVKVYLSQTSAEELDRLQKDPDPHAERLQESLRVFVRAPGGTILSKLPVKKNRVEKPTFPSGWLKFRRQGAYWSTPDQYEPEKEWFPSELILTDTGSEQRALFVLPLKKWLAKTQLNANALANALLRIRLESRGVPHQNFESAYFSFSSPKVLLTRETTGELQTVDRVELHGDGTLHFLIRTGPDYSEHVAKHPDAFADLLQSSLSVFGQKSDGAVTERRHGHSRGDPNWISFAPKVDVHSSRPHRYEQEKASFPYEFVEGNGKLKRHRFIIPLEQWLSSTGMRKEFVEGCRFKLRLRDPILQFPIVTGDQLREAGYETTGLVSSKEDAPTTVYKPPGEVETDFFNFPLRENAKRKKKKQGATDSAHRRIPWTPAPSDGAAFEGSNPYD